MHREISSMEQTLASRGSAQELSLELPSPLICALGDECFYLMEPGDFPHIILGIQKLEEARLLPLALTGKGEIRSFSDALELPSLPCLQGKMRSSQKRFIIFPLTSESLQSDGLIFNL